MLKSKSPKQPASPDTSDRIVRVKAKKTASDGMVKIMSLLVFCLVAAAGIFLNLNKVNGQPTVFGFSLSGGGGVPSYEEQRRAIMDSDISDALKASKLQRLVKEE